MDTVFTITTVGERGEVIGTPSFLIEGRLTGDQALHVLLSAVNRWFMEAPLDDTRAEAEYSGGEDYNFGDLLSSGRVLSGLAAYGVTALDTDVPAGGPYRLAEAIGSHHKRLLNDNTLMRVFPECFDG